MIFYTILSFTRIISSIQTLSNHITKDVDPLSLTSAQIKEMISQFKIA